MQAIPVVLKTKLCQKIHQSGLTLLEVLLSIGILSMVIVGVAALSSTYTDSMVSNDYALLIKTVGEAATEYIQDNPSEFKDTATPTTPALLKLDKLISSQYLDGGLGATNTYKHNICVLVLKPDPLNNEKYNALLVTEGGTAMDDINLSETAAVIGAAGGGIYTDNHDIIKGVLSGWKLERTTSAFFSTDLNKHCDGSAGNIDFSAGHVYMALWFPKKKKEAVLHRDKVAGQEYLNTMSTPIIMNAPQIEGDACSNIGAIANEGVVTGFDSNNQKIVSSSQIIIDPNTNTPKQLAAGTLLSCDGSKWVQQKNRYWAAPVATYADLDAIPCDSSHHNQTRVVETPAVGQGRRAYTCNANAAPAKWEALGVDNDGNLIVAGKTTIDQLDGNLKVVKEAIIGNPCAYYDKDGVASSGDGMIAKEKDGSAIISCQGGKWGVVGHPPKTVRQVFTSSGIWVVPKGVTTAYVTMAGGGGSGAGRRIVNAVFTGHSGGYVFSHPVNVTPGETLTITVGGGGVGYGTVETAVMSNYEFPAFGSGYYPFHVYAIADNSDDGLGGWPGQVSQVISTTKGVLLECTGGAGVYVGPIDSFYRLPNPPSVEGQPSIFQDDWVVAGNLAGASVGNGTGQILAPNRPSGNGNHIQGSSNDAGHCGEDVNTPSTYGRGNRGAMFFAVSSGYYSGGLTPFGYGSGGGVARQGCYVTQWIRGTCINPINGRDGVVIIDATY